MEKVILNQASLFGSLAPKKKVVTIFDEIEEGGLEQAYNKLTDYLYKLAKERFLFKHPDKEFLDNQLQGLSAVRDWIFGYKKTDNGFEKINREKGLWLYGDVGTGKTFAMKVFYDFLYSIRKDGGQYLRNNLVLFKTQDEKKQYVLPAIIPVVQARVIRQQYNSVLNNEDVELFHYERYNNYRWLKYESGGNYDFTPFTVNNVSDLMKRYANLPVLIIDDLGAENGVVNHYGTKVNVIEEILSARYDLDKLTFVTTNIVNPKEVYDKRICSRMNEMFTSVLVDGKDLREKL